MRTADAVHVSLPDVPVDRALVLREGAVPPGLRGALVRNGPGLVELGGEPLHLLDGHAALAAASFAGGEGRLRARHVETPWLAAERAAGRPRFRRLFTNLPGRLANVLRIARAGSVAHDVHAWGGRLVATDDHHVAVDATTLETVGPVAWDLGPGKRNACPMPRVDPATGRLVGYALREGGVRPDALTFVEVDADGRIVSRSAEFRLSTSPAIVHDVAFTPGFYVVTEAGARLSPLAALAGQATLFQSFRWPADAPLNLWLVARPGGERAVRVALPAPAKVAFHVANAFEDGGRVVVDLVTYDGPVDFDRLGPPALRARWGTTAGVGPAPTLRRYVVDPVAGTVVEARDLAATPLELPEVDPRRFGRPYGVVFGGTPGAAEGSEPDPNGFPYFHGLVRVDVGTGRVATWDAGPRRFVSGPAFAPSSDVEGEGWILAYVHDVDRGETDVVVLDAADLAAGPVAVLATGCVLPPSTHVLWVPA